MSLLNESFYVSCLSTFHLLYIVILGVVAKNLKLVDGNFEKSLSKLITNILLPAFIFCEIILNFSIKYYHLIFQSLLGCVTLYATGLFVGYISARVTKLNTNRTNFLLGVFSSPHTTSIPLILIEVVHPILAKISNMEVTADTMDPLSRGRLYIVLNSIFSNLWRWTVPYNLINAEVEESNEITEIEEPLIERKHQARVIKASEPLTCSKFFKEIINMPVVVSLSSLLICMFPNVQSLFSSPDALLNDTIVSVNLIIGKSYSFLVMFVLGLNFSDLLKTKDPNDKTINQTNTNEKCVFDKYELGFFTFMKLILMPIVACPVIMSFFLIGIIDDDVMVFLFFFMAAAPSAINVIVICSIKNAYKNTIAAFMIIMYISSIFTLTFQISFFLYILSVF